MSANARGDREIAVLESIAESLRVIAAKPVVIPNVLTEEDLAMVEENFPRYERPWYFLMSVKVPRQPDAFDYLTDEDIERLEQYAQNLIEDRHEEVRAAKQRLSSPLRPIDDVDLPACGDPDCQHAPDGGNHPVNPS